MSMVLSIPFFIGLLWEYFSDYCVLSSVFVLMHRAVLFFFFLCPPLFLNEILPRPYISLGTHYLMEFRGLTMQRM